MKDSLHQAHIELLGKIADLKSEYIWLSSSIQESDELSETEKEYLDLTNDAIDSINSLTRQIRKQLNKVL